jgi:hypothetical protein
LYCNWSLLKSSINFVCSLLSFSYEWASTFEDSNLLILVLSVFNISFCSESVEIKFLLAYFNSRFLVSNVFKSLSSLFIISSLSWSKIASSPHGSYNSYSMILCELYLNIKINKNQCNIIQKFINIQKSALSSKISGL